MWLLCSFQGPWRGLYTGLRRACAEAISISPLRPTPGGRRSLKAQQHAGGLDAGLLRAPSRTGPDERRGAPVRFGRHARPGLLLSPSELTLRPVGLDEIERPLGPGHCYVLPRKEVIQPQLPLRLPCYDFTPVTSPTFDGSLPCGLGHRLRVLLTPVV